MRDVDDDHRGRTDGLTARQEIQMLGRLARGGVRWTRGSERREKCVDVVERILDDDRVHPLVQLKAVDLAIKMEQQNMIDERMDGEVTGGGERVVLVLPMNHTEVGCQEEDGSHDKTEE